MNLSQYIGIPFLDHGRDRDGCDCWGLAALVYKEQLGIVGLPDMGDAYSDAYAHGEVSAAIEAQSKKDWNYDVTAQAWKPLDIMVFKRCGVDAHIALYVRPTEMLHVVRGACAAIERYDTMKWERRLSRVVRLAG